MAAETSGPTKGGDEKWTKGGVISTPAEGQDIEQMALRAEGAVADPAALGLFGFGIGTIEIALVLSGFVPLAQLPAGAVSLLLTAGIAQFLAGLLGFFKGNNFAGTAFSIYGANNMVVATFILLQKIGIVAYGPPDNLVLGVELACMTYISAVLGLAALKTYRIFVTTILLVVPAFGLSAAHEFGLADVIGAVGGYFFIASSVMALYAGGAVVINAAWQRPLLPMGKI